jgi:hypothetical protein
MFYVENSKIKIVPWELINYYALLTVHSINISNVNICDINVYTPMIDIILIICREFLYAL